MLLIRGRGVSHRVVLSTLVCLAAALPACSAEDQESGRGRGEAGGPTQVGFVVLRSTSAAATTELAGRVTAFESSEVRPQVSGVIRRRFFTEGALVRAGQTLYQIDPRLYVAAVNEASANVQSARANAEATRVRSDRLRPLAEMEAVAAQDATDAAAAARQARASVAQTSAALETARINLRFTDVPAPITGRIGRSLFTVGALVTANQVEPLAMIQRLDPMFVDIQQSSADLLALRRALARDGVVPASAAVRLKLEDGSDYGVVGTVQFAEAMVNASTGTVTLRARFANPQGILLPSMFVRAVFAQAVDTRAVRVPQQAVSRDPNGTAFVFLVGPGNRAVRREVVADRADGTDWIVTRGLAAGDRAIVQGTGNLRQGQPLAPVPASAPQRVAPPAPGDQRAGSAPKRG